MNIEKLFEILKAEPAYRAGQVKRAIFVDLIDDWSKATNLPIALRKKFDADCPLQIDGQIF